MPKRACVYFRIVLGVAVALPLVMQTGLSFAQETGQTSRYETRKRELNENVVTIISSGTVSSYTMMAEDIQNVVDQPKVPGGLRVLPILGRGGAHNALDVLLLKGVDMGVMEKDDLLVATKKEPVVFATGAQRLQYIAKIANNDYQLIARQEIKSIYDLKGKKVNFLKKMSSTNLACETIFKALNIDVEPVFFDQETASAKLRRGEISAFARFAPAPHGAFKGFRASDGFHFLPIDADVLPPGDYAKLLKKYSPTLLTNEIYPALVPPDQPVPSVAGSLLLFTYAWPAGTERYGRMINFVDRFFSNISKFKKPGRHPQWKAINLAYDVPGWTRFKPAQDWLEAHKSSLHTASTGSGRSKVRDAFDEFLRKNGGTADMSAAQREAMFSKFMQWWKTQQVSQP